MPHFQNADRRRSNRRNGSASFYSFLATTKIRLMLSVKSRGVNPASVQDRRPCWTPGFRHSGGFREQEAGDITVRPTPRTRYLLPDICRLTGLVRAMLGDATVQRAQGEVEEGWRSYHVVEGRKRKLLEERGFFIGMVTRLRSSGHQS